MMKQVMQQMKAILLIKVKISLTVIMANVCL